MRNKKRFLSQGLLHLANLALLVIVMFPLLWMVSSSLKTPAQVFESPFRWITDSLRFSNYAEVWTNPDLPYWKMIVNSLLIALGSVVGQLLISSLAAYAFAKIPFAGKSFIFMLMLTTMMIPVQALIIPRFMLYHKLNLYDTLWCVIFPNFFNVTSIFLLRQFSVLYGPAQRDGGGSAD